MDDYITYRGGQYMRVDDIADYQTLTVNNDATADTTYTYEFNGWDDAAIAADTATNRTNIDGLEYTLTADADFGITDWGEYARPERVTVYHDENPWRAAIPRDATITMDGFTVNWDNFGRLVFTPEEAKQYAELVKSAEDQPDLEDEKGGALDDFLESFGGK